MVLTLMVYTAVLPVLLAMKERAARIVLALSAVLMAASLSLPPSGPALKFWRSISGASWCALLLTTVLVYLGCRALSAFDTRSNDGAGVRPDLGPSSRSPL
jgi:hypothetical protein